MPEAGILSKYQGKEEFYLSSELPGISLGKKKSHYVYITFLHTMAKQSIGHCQSPEHLTQ